jgi:hypothetical protein
LARVRSEDRFVDLKNDLSGFVPVCNNWTK